MCVLGSYLDSSNEFGLILGMIGGIISDAGGTVNLHTCIYPFTLTLSHVDELFHWACSIIGQFTVSARLAFHVCTVVQTEKRLWPASQCCRVP